MLDNKEYQRQWYIKNRDKLKIRHKEYYIENQKHILNKCKQYRINNKRQISEYGKEYRLTHKAKINKYFKDRQRVDMKFNLNRRIGSAIWKSLRGNKEGKNWETLIGYTLEDLIKRLKKTMPKGYSWQDYLEGKLHIDHKIPISAFNFTEPEHIDFKRCWALSNLQFLPARENLIKNDKLYRPFQPTLQILI